MELVQHSLDHSEMVFKGKKNVKKYFKYLPLRPNVSVKLGYTETKKEHRP